MNDPTQPSKSGPPERTLLSDQLRLVPVFDLRASDAVEEELRPLWEAELHALADTREPPYRERILRGGAFLSLARLTAPHVLRDLIQCHFEEWDAERNPVEPLLGGHVLFEGVRPVLKHGCCCDLRESLMSWDAASHAHQRPISYFDIGHGLTAFPSWEEPWLVLREGDDENDWPVTHEWRLSPQALGPAVHAARQEQEAFARRLEPYLAERFPAEAVSELAATLAGLR